MEFLIPGKSRFSAELNSILGKDLKHKTLFYLTGDFFTGKSHFARLYATKQGVVPISLNLQLAQQTPGSIDEFKEATGRAKSEGSKHCIIVDDVDKNIELWLRLASFLNDITSPTCLFIISNQKRLEVFKGLRLNEWDITEIHFPRLKNRTEDIIPFICHMYHSFHGEELQIDPEAQKVLELYDWPLNLLDVQQLARDHAENVMNLFSLPEKFFDGEFNCEFSGDGIKLDEKSSLIWKCKIKRIESEVHNLEGLAARLNLSVRSVRFLKALSA